MIVMAKEPSPGDVSSNCSFLVQQILTLWVHPGGSGVKLSSVVLLWHIWCCAEGIHYTMV